MFVVTAGNQIGDAGARALAESLKQLTSLTQLRLDSTLVSHDHERALVSVFTLLPPRPSLVSLFRFRDERRHGSEFEVMAGRPGLILHSRGW